MSDWQSSRAGQDREASGEKQPFLAKFHKRSLSSCAFGYENDEPTRGNEGTVKPTDLFDTASYAIAHDRTPDPT
jgi:hypothetical protein